MNLLCFLLCFTMMTNPITEELRTPQKVVRELKTTEAIEYDKIAPLAEKKTFFGICRITFYCPCSACCGSWGNATASGVMPTANHTVANGCLPFGTRIMVDGAEYVVEDRGVGDFEIDIFVNDHQEALNRGLYYADVYILGE